MYPRNCSTEQQRQQSIREKIDADRRHPRPDGRPRVDGRELGVSENQAASGAEALIPAILGGFKKRAQSQPSGVEGLGDLLGQLGGGSLMDNVLSPEKRSKGLDSTCRSFLLGRFRTAEKSKIFTLSY